MNNRLFTFGCSFTSFYWPTWADILGREFDQFENWGRFGAGNAFMLYSLMECNKRNQLTKDDTVIIMWSSIDREDRWINGDWQLQGGVFNGHEPYTGDYAEKFADPTGFLIRDLAIISAVKYILESIGCRWYFLSMVPLYYQDRSYHYWLEFIQYKRWMESLKEEFDLDSSIINLYADEISAIKPSIYEVVFNNDWYSRPGQVDLRTFESSYKSLAGPDWPSVQDFLKQNFIGIASNIKAEITKRLYIDKNRIRTDTHPIPLEHLEYLEKVLPEISISDKTKIWVNEVNQRVLTLDDTFTWKTTIPDMRF
jgi:hypothetical protein